MMPRQQAGGATASCFFVVDMITQKNTHIHNTQTVRISHDPPAAEEQGKKPAMASVADTT